MHYLANVSGIEHILAIKVFMPMGGGGYPECHAGCLYKHHASYLLSVCSLIVKRES